MIPSGARFLLCALLLGLTHCGPAAGSGPPTASHPPSTPQWRAAHHLLDQLRAEYGPAGPYTMRLALELTEPHTGQHVRARGVVTAAPAQEALRLVLLGPGGTTALDLWICRDRFRFVLPAAGLHRRGDGRTDPELRRGLPVEFLRWWLLRPLQGRLLFHAEQAGSQRFVLRDADDVVDLHLGPTGALTVERRSRSDRHRVETGGPGCQAVRYQQRSTGIDITVDCEKLKRHQTPKADAFVDPDHPERGCLERTQEPS